MAPALSIFIGYDEREAVAWQVLAHSILRRSSQSIAIVPLNRASLSKCYWRERGPTESTDFSLTRFLVPYLSGYQGWSLFLDCDMLCLTDIARMLAYPLVDDARIRPTRDAVKAGSVGHAVYVCQHDYIPRALLKFDGHEQTKYPRKNWSSVMLFDCAQCRMLTPEYVNTASGLELHRLQWLPDSKIGSLPLEWNYLVGEDNQSPDPAAIVHYTNAGPWHAGYTPGAYHDEWMREFAHMLGGTAHLLREAA